MPPLPASPPLELEEEAEAEAEFDEDVEVDPVDCSRLSSQPINATAIIKYFVACMMATTEECAVGFRFSALFRTYRTPCNEMSPRPILAEIMDHENLRVLLQIVDSGSIQGAARCLNLSRSLLRRRLDLLEAEVGVPLLHRNVTGVQLTPAGSIVVQQGRFVLENTQMLLADARAAADNATGIIRVIEPIGMPLTGRVQTLLVTHAAVPKLKIIVRHVEDPLAHLHEPCELVLHDGRIPEKGSWFSRVVVRLKLQLLASPAYLQARGVPQRASDLAQHDILGWKRPRQPVDEWPLLAGGTVKVAPWFVSPDFFLLRTLASQGGGIVLAPQSPLIDEPEADRLMPVLENQIGTELVFRASSPNPTHADPRTRAVLEQIQMRLKGFPEDEN